MSGGTPDFAGPATRRRSRQRRFLALSIPALAVLAVAMGVSFLGNTGTSTASVTGGSSNFVYPVSNGATVPTSVNALKYTPSTAITAGAIGSGVVLPSWTPVAQAAGTVSTAGDLALIDASSATNGITVTMYVTNLAGLQQDYSSLALPVNVYSSPCTAGSCTWTQASSVISSATYLTSTSGYLTFNLPASGKYYDITIDTGGSFYCTSTSTAGTATLSPSYYFTAQPY